MRIRAAAILIQNETIALMERHREGRHYFSFPGGGVDAGESPEQAVVREVHEELGVDVRVLQLVAEVWFRGNQQFFFLVRQTGGEFGTGEGEEYSPNHDPARGAYHPIWMPIAEIPVNDVLPQQVAALVTGSHRENWPREPVLILDAGA